MPLIYALDALPGLHPGKYKTETVERAVNSAIEIVQAELGRLVESEEASDIARLLGKLQ